MCGPFCILALMTTVTFFEGGALLMPDDVVKDDNGNPVKVVNYVKLPGAPYDPLRAWQEDLENYLKSAALPESEIDKYIYDKK